MKNITNREMTRVRRTTQWLFLLAGIGITPALMAQQNAATLDHIQSSSVLNVGYRQLPPFSSTGHNDKVMGYAIAVRNTITGRLRRYPKLNDLVVHHIPVNFAERFPALNSRKIDMDCGANINTPERTTSVSLSENYYTVEICITSLHKNSIRSISDPKGRTVGLAGSSKGLPGFNKANRGQHLNISTITGTTIKGAFGKMAYNEPVAFFIDDILA